MVIARETGREIRAAAEEERADRENVARFRIQENDRPSRAGGRDRQASGAVNFEENP